MKQLSFIKTNRLKWEEVAEPTITLPSDALVRPFLVARCDLDAAFLHSNVFKKYSIGRLLGLTDPSIPEFVRKDLFKGPFPMGHECVAEIVALGKDVQHFRIGQKVIIPFQISCGECPVCNSGLTSHCEVTGSFNMFSGIGKHIDNGGTLSDILKVPFAQKMLIPVPDGMNLDGLASASDNLPDAWCRVAPYLLNHPGKKVLIIGGSAKSIGLYAAYFAKEMEAQVDYIDFSEERIGIAIKIGINAFYKDFKSHQGQYDLIVNASNSQKAIKLGVRLLKPGGVLSSANIYFNKSVGVPFFQLYSKNITLITGLANPMHDIPAMLEFIKKSKMEPELITTHLGSWDNAAEDMLKHTTKVIVKREPIKR